MKNTFLLLCGLAALHTYAQPSQATLDSLRKLSDEDHRQMLEQLNIKTLRPGANPNDPKSPNAANYDEAKANPYPVLPDPLVFKNGRKVTSAAQWPQRRAEIVEDFEREIYGRIPKNVPSVKWVQTNKFDRMIGDIPVTSRFLSGIADNSGYPAIQAAIQAEITLPSNASKPVPVIIELGFIPPPTFPGDTSRAARFAAASLEWKKLVLEQGWGYAVIVPTSFQADNGAGLTQGIIGLTNKGQRRKPDDWGALRAWAWGASKLLDYLETDKTVDAKKVGIEGHSRYGKAALVAVAFDKRFATGFISSSGEGGAKLHRRNWGELVENLASSWEYHWMAGNFIKYAGPLTWNDLPVDAHELIALAAPRPLFISSGNIGEAWIDVKGMFMATVAAGPVYKLLGKKDLGATEFPKLETGLMDGDLSFRQHAGPHTPAPNWPTFVEFARRYFGTVSIEPKKIVQIKGLKDYYKDYFTIGAAVTPRSLKTDEAQLVLQQFNSLTAENAMKMGPIHPLENEYYWKDADSIVAFAKRNGLKMRGHTLVWHNQTPRWLYTDAKGDTVSKEVLLQRLKDHIQTVVKRYKGTIYAWDVVNEVISDNSDEFYRNSPLYRICGEEFIRKAFEWAHEADPDALLFYNDYNEHIPVKRDKIFQFVKQLKESGVPVHGFGMQGHWGILEPTEEDLDNALRRYGQLGLKVQITELDVSVYPKEHSVRQRVPADSADAFTPEREKQQMAIYEMCFRLFRKHKQIISSVTFWNISDRSSWLDNFPIRGRKDYPLLFDKDLKPKKAFWEVVRFAGGSGLRGF